MVTTESGSLMTESNDINSSEASEPVHIPREFGTASCDAVRAMLEKIYQPAPGYNNDRFCFDSNHLLIELTKELTNDHLSIKQAEMLYSSIYLRTEESLLPFREIPGHRSWHDAESAKNQIRDDNRFYSQIFLDCVERVSKRALLFTYYKPAELCSFREKE